MRRLLWAPIWTAVLLTAVLGAAQKTDEAERHCVVLNNDRRASDAAACYAKLREMAEGDTPLTGRALLGQARNEVWSGNWRAAGRAFEEYLKIDPADRAAMIEYIRVLRYQGNYSRAERLCDRLLQADPRDAEALAVRAEVLYWAGNRGVEGRRNAEQALRLEPELSQAKVARIAALEELGLNREASAEARALRDQTGTPPSGMAEFVEERLDRKTRIRGDLPFSVYNDSDGIHNTGFQSQVSLPILKDNSLHLGVSEFTASAPTGGIFTDGRNRAPIREFSVGGTALVAPGLHVSVSGGGSTIENHNDFRPTFEAVLTGVPRDRWDLQLGTDRKFLAVTPRAIDHDIHSQGLFVQSTYWFDARTSVAVRAERRFWSDTNRSITGEAAVSRKTVYGRGFNLDTGALAQYQSFQQDLLANSGFFTPDRYSRYAGFLEAHGEAPKAVSWEMRGEGGSQQITSASDFRPNWAVTARLGIQINSTIRLYGSYERKNYSLLSRDGWYQGFTFSLTVQPGK